MKKLPILVDLDEEVSVGVCNIEQGVSFLCIRLDCADSPEWFVDDACSAIGVHCTIFDFDDDILLRLGRETRFLPHGYNLCVYPVGCILNVHVFHSVIVH